MSKPTNDYDHLWNDLPEDERKRLLPHAIESQKLHIWQCKQTAIRAHKRHMKELDEWMKNLDDSLRRLKMEQ